MHVKEIIQSQSFTTNRRQLSAVLIILYLFFPNNTPQSIYTPNKLVSCSLHWYNLSWKYESDVRPYNETQSHCSPLTHL